MILKNTLYHIDSVQNIDDGQYLAHISLHRESEIFKAHFPNLPIVPGACLVQISKEFIEKNLQQKIQITHFKNLKFLKTINPDEFPEITIIFSILNSQFSIHYSASITFSKDEHLFCKLDYLFNTL
jgi:3-hydroxyacyl-[acyl-carrier-protein] dehydratase